MLKTSNFFMNNTFYNIDDMEVLYAGNYDELLPKGAYDEVFYFDEDHNEFFCMIREYNIVYNWRKTKKNYVMIDNNVRGLSLNEIIESLVNTYGEIDLAKGLIERFSVKKVEVKKKRGRKPKHVIDNKDTLPIPPVKPTPPPPLSHKKV